MQTVMIKQNSLDEGRICMSPTLLYLSVFNEFAVVLTRLDAAYINWYWVKSFALYIFVNESFVEISDFLLDLVVNSI